MCPNGPGFRKRRSTQATLATLATLAVGAISVDPECRPGARRLSEIRRKIEAHKIVCVFSQPQFPDATVRALTEGTAVRHARLDELGSELQIGPDLYFKMMRKLAENLTQCLNGAPKK